MANEQTDVRWKQRFANYKKALSLLGRAIDIIELAQSKGEVGDEFELQQEGLIQRFEYTWELAWNVMKDYLTDQGNFEIRGSRDAFKEAFKIGLIDDEVGWRETIVSRQQTAHNYDEEVIDAIGEDIMSRYYGLFCAFEKKMKSIIGNEQ